jgi:signal transduction histidine kinase
MFRSLYSKLAAALAGLFCLVGLLFVVVTIFSTEMYQQEVSQRLNSKLAEHIVAGKLLMQDNRVNQEALKEVFDMLMMINPSIEIYLLDPQGNILAFSALPEQVKRNRVDLGPVRKWLAGNVRPPFSGDDPRSGDGQKIFTAARIPKQGKLQGYIYVILGGEVYDNIIQKLKGSYILQLSAWMILASLLFAFISGLIVFSGFTGRLKRLANIMDEFKRVGRLKQVDPSLKRVHKPDEIDQLSSIFKDMAENIEDQMDTLRNSDAMRRELIANISHDLRTPLATLQSCIETLLLKEDSLTGAERRGYLETAIKHCKRLSKLVGELLELARLESYGIRVEREPFNLSEFVQDVVEKFRLRAKDQGVKIATSIEGKLPFVNADIALIERVLENLMENAIYHTPRGGSVSIVLARDNEAISVQVRDTGHGIPEGELPHIFDRFYQLDKSRKQDRGHSGLGLAIAKRILELHAESIKVTSVLGSGTSFIFQLPVYMPS